MRAGMVVAIVLLTLVVIALAAGGWLFFMRPLAVYEWQTRFALRSAGLARHEVATGVGGQTVFRGGSGPLLVLLHGAGDQAGSWSRVAPSLARRFTVIVPDLAGHGDSAPADGPLPMATVLGGLEAVLESELAGQRATLVGNSLGGWLALLVAHRRPEWVTRAVIENGGAIRGHEEEITLLPADRKQAREVMALLRDGASRPVPGFVLDDLVRAARVGPLARFAATAETMEGFILDGHLGEIAAPVDLIWGESDKVMPLDYARRMMAELPRARLMTVPSCGHVPHVECPNAFLAALLPLLEERP